VQTVTWSLSSGPGSVNSSTGLYSAPASGTTSQQAVVVATSTIDTATPVTGSTIITIASGYKVSGTIGLQGCTNLAQPVTITLRPSTGSIISQNVTLSSTGTFSLAAIPNGTYTVHIKGAKWLAKNVTGVVVKNGAVSGVNATLLPGDANGDNVVNLADFDILAAAYGTSTGESAFNTDADFNCDGVIDLTDFDLLAADYGLSGDP
jgi:hypothetical protein